MYCFQAFNGLGNTGGYTGTPTLSLDCGFTASRTMALLSDSLTANLAWVEEMMVSGENRKPSLAFRPAHCMLYFRTSVLLMSLLLLLLLFSSYAAIVLQLRSVINNNEKHLPLSILRSLHVCDCVRLHVSAR